MAGGRDGGGGRGGGGERRQSGFVVGAREALCTRVGGTGGDARGHVPSPRRSPPTPVSAPVFTCAPASALCGWKGVNSLSLSLFAAVSPSVRGVLSAFHFLFGVIATLRSSAICQVMSWQHVDQPCEAGELFDMYEYIYISLSHLPP